MAFCAPSSPYAHPGHSCKAVSHPMSPNSDGATVACPLKGFLLEMRVELPHFWSFSLPIASKVAFCAPSSPYVHPAHSCKAASHLKCPSSAVAAVAGPLKGFVLEMRVELPLFYGLCVFFLLWQHHLRIHLSKFVVSSSTRLQDCESMAAFY